MKTINKYWNFSRDGDAVVLDIFGQIGEGMFVEGITPKMIQEELNGAGATEKLIVNINSGGGSVFDGIAIYNLLLSHKSHKTVNILGVAGSIASVIAQAGDDRNIATNATMMIHNPTAFLFGDYDAGELDKTLKALEAIKDAIIASYAKTRLSDNEIIDLMDMETWMNAERAVELGFADAIFPAPAIKVTNSAAYFNKVDIKDVVLFPDKVQNATSLNRTGVAHANSLINSGDVDETSGWSFSAEDGNELLGPEGDDWGNYSKHHLGIHPDQPEQTKAHYGYPCMKNDKVYRSGVIAARQRAAAQGETDIENAAGALLDKIDKGNNGEEKDVITDKCKKDEEDSMNNGGTVGIASGGVTFTSAATINVVAIDSKREGVNMEERERVTEILQLGELHDCMDEATAAVKTGMSVEDFKGKILETKYNAKKVTVDPAIGLSQNEVKRYSIVNAVSSIINERWHRVGCFEKECSEAVAKKIGKEPRGFFIPHDVQMNFFRNDLTVTSAPGGGYLVGTAIRPEEFIDVLRNRTMLAKLGARTIGGLVGDIAIPKKTAAASTYWVSGDQSAPTEGSLTFGQLGLQAKTVGTYIDISRRLINNASLDVESLVRDDLTTGIAVGIDAAGINGSGTGSEPRGILKTSGIGDVVIGDNGGAITYTKCIEVWGKIAVANADRGLAYLTNAKVIADCAKIQKVATYGTSFIIDRLPDANGMAELAGIPCGMSNNVPCNLTKGTSSGVCSALICGDFSQLIIALWTGVDINVDVSTFSYMGGVRIVALQDADIGVRIAGAFAADQDITTTL